MIKKRLSVHFDVLCRDPVIIVKKSLCTSLYNLIQSNTNYPFLPSLILTFASDQSPAVQIELPRIFRHLSHIESFAKCITDGCQSIISGSNWQSKAVLLNDIDHIFETISASVLLKIIVSKCPTDKSPEIRAAFIQKIYFFIQKEILDVETAKKLIKDFLTDPSVFVRVCLAEQFSRLNDFPSYRPVIAESLTHFLKQKEIDVKIAALKSISQTGLALDSASIQLDSLLEKANWRIKKNIADIFPEIARKNTNQFPSLLEKCFFKLFYDDASDVRQSAINSSVVILKDLGKKWGETSLKPQISQLFKNPNYQLREVAIQLILKNKLIDDFESLLKEALKDPIPNVRIQLARDLPRDSPYLKILLQDEDKDVQTFAKQ